MTFGIALHFFGRADRDRFAMIQNRNPLADVHHQLHVMLDQQDAEIEPVTDKPNQVHQFDFSCGFIPAAGSSRRRIFGFVASARAISSRR